jgi:hypothetical protein
MNSSAQDAELTQDRPHATGGPNPGMLAIVTLGLTLLGLLLGGLLSGGATLSSPFTDSATVATRLQQHPDAVRVASLIQFGSAIPLGIFAATVYARQLRLGVRVPGPAISYFGGIFASVMLAFSALVGWVTSRPEVTGDASLTHALAYLSFLLGGVGFVVGLGLLIAGIAVPALILGLVPKWLAWVGLVIAVLSELSFLSLALDPLQFLLPIGRFGGLAWLVAVGFLLPRTRAAARVTRRSAAR